MKKNKVGFCVFLIGARKNNKRFNLNFDLANQR